MYCTVRVRNDIRVLAEMLGTVLPFYQCIHIFRALITQFLIMDRGDQTEYKQVNRVCFRNVRRSNHRHGRGMRD